MLSLGGRSMDVGPWRGYPCGPLVGIKWRGSMDRFSCALEGVPRTRSPGCSPLIVVSGMVCTGGVAWRGSTGGGFLELGPSTGSAGGVPLLGVSWGVHWKVSPIRSPLQVVPNKESPGRGSL
jgi:hypothetical protein